MSKESKKSSQKSKKAHGKKPLPEFDKYKFYVKSVQSPDADVEFLVQAFKESYRRVPKIMREDFCGTFCICCSWVKMAGQNRAIGVDLDDEPIEYGRKHYLSRLKPEQQRRIEILKANVLDKKLPKADVIAALNFSYFIFKERRTMLQYFENCYRTLNKQGILVLDIFGGGECYEPNEHETEYDKYSYFWDQDTFNHVTHESMFYIHFKRKGEKKREKVFTYDWRLWSIPEIKDLLAEAGFKNSHVYWEETDRKGEGTGVFTRTTTGENTEAWVCYIVAEK